MCSSDLAEREGRERCCACASVFGHGELGNPNRLHIARPLRGAAAPAQPASSVRGRGEQVSSLREKRGSCCRRFPGLAGRVRSAPPPSLAGSRQGSGYGRSIRLLALAELALCSRDVVRGSCVASSCGAVPSPGSFWIRFGLSLRQCRALRRRGRT